MQSLEFLLDGGQTGDSVEMQNAYIRCGVGFSPGQTQNMSLLTCVVIGSEGTKMFVSLKQDA